MTQLCDRCGYQQPDHLFQPERKVCTPCRSEQRHEQRKRKSAGLPPPTVEVVKSARDRRRERLVALWLRPDVDTPTIAVCAELLFLRVVLAAVPYREIREELLPGIAAAKKQASAEVAKVIEYLQIVVAADEGFASAEDVFETTGNMRVSYGGERVTLRRAAAEALHAWFTLQRDPDPYAYPTRRIAVTGVPMGIYTQIEQALRRVK